MSLLKKFNKKLSNINEIINSISKSDSALKNRIIDSINNLRSSFSDNLKQMEKLKKHKKISKELKKENKLILKELNSLKKDLDKVLLLKTKKTASIEDLKTNINIMINVHTGKDL